MTRSVYNGALVDRYCGSVEVGVVWDVCVGRGWNLSACTLSKCVYPV